MGQTASDKYCWCNSGTLQFAGRNWSGVPMPHIHGRYNDHRRELTDEEWTEAMRDTPHAAELTAERERIHAAKAVSQ